MACMMPPVVDTDKNDAPKHTEALFVLLQPGLMFCWCRRYRFAAGLLRMFR